MACELLMQCDLVYGFFKMCPPRGHNRCGPCTWESSANVASDANILYLKGNFMVLILVFAIFPHI